MRIVQTVFGVFHHFALARELRSRGHLQHIYSSWPWARLQREALPHELVSCFPAVHLAELAAARLGWGWAADHLGYANALAFDDYTLRQVQRLPEAPQALVGISGSSLKTGAWLQRQGGVFVCDRGSTHQRFQAEILTEEYSRWGVPATISDPRDTAREEAIYAQANVVVVPSEQAKNSFISCGYPVEKLRVIPYGVELGAFQPAEPGPAAETFEVLFAGAAGLRKGLPYLLEAYAAVQYPRKRLRIAGDIQAELKPLLSRLPTESVEWLGPVSRARLVELMQTSHALVLPSVEDGFGLVMAEAMACGCPVVASENTGARDLFTDGVEGFVVPAQDAAAITQRLQQLADDRDLQQRMRQASLQRVRKLGGWQDYGARWEALLQELVA